jgi:hypothetical protein
VTQTLQQLITAAYILIGVVADGKAPSPYQSQKGYEVLNDNLLTQQRDGWNLGWYPQSGTIGAINLGANAPLRDEDIGDVKLALCSWLAPHMGVTIPPPPMTNPDDPLSLSVQIRNAFIRLTKRSLRYVEADLGELSRPQGGPWGGPNWF